MNFLSTFVVLLVSVGSVLGSNVNQWRVKRNGNQGCGLPSQTTGLIVGGSDLQRGAWPWMVALMLKSKSSPQFFCGGVLVSSTKILTAAHCIQNKDKQLRKLPREVLLLFGAYDLNDLFQTGSLSSSPSEIIIHPDWNPFNQRFDADIAALIIEDDIPYTKYIRPICLPTAEQSASEGYVTGWGESEDKTKEFENIPKQIKIPIHANDKCFLESSEFTKIASLRTICGGSRDNVGPCRGDSGGGLFVKAGNVFQLKGLVSASLINLGGCDVTNFALYTNVDKFIDWIQNPTEEWSAGKPVLAPLYNSNLKTVTCDFESKIYGHTATPLLSCVIGTQRIDSEGFEIFSSRNESVGSIEFGHNKNIFLLPVKISEIFPNLREFSAAYCSVRKVSKANFKNLQHLKALNLERNYLQTIDDDTFADLESLEFLSLIQNQIVSMSAASVSHLKNLKVLIMQNNECINESNGNNMAHFFDRLNQLCGRAIENIQDDKELKLKSIQHRLEISIVESKYLKEQIGT